MASPGVRTINSPPAAIASAAVVILSFGAALESGLDLALVPLAIASAAYLAGLLVGPMLVERRAWGRAGYFPVQVALTAALLAAGPGVMALAPMALVSHAVLYLRPRHAALVIGAVVVMTVGSTYALPGWSALGATLSYATAVTFVVGFSRIAAGQHDERQRATRLAGELADAHARLHASVDQIAELASARERNRIAREVHDGLGHALTVVHVQLEAARDVLARDPARAAQILARVQAVVQCGLRDVRSSVGLLRDDSRPRALADAIEAWAAELRAEGIAVAVDLPSTSTAVPPATAHVLYRAAQEAVTNVRKHAAARAVAIAMANTDDVWRLRIADDGRGATALDDRGFGLTGIRERVAALGGTVAIDTTPGRGFALTLELPRSA